MGAGKDVSHSKKAHQRENHPIIAQNLMLVFTKTLMENLEN